MILIKEYVFDEKRKIEAIINSNYIDYNNIVYTIKDLARYNHYILGLSTADNYNSIHEYMDKNSDEYTEIGFYREIRGCIRDAKKSPWRDIKEIVITKDELNTITSLNDERKEKIAFVLLADAKYDRAWKQHEYTSSFLSLSDLYKLARVTMPRNDRAGFLSFLIESGLVKENLNPKLKNRDLTYIVDESEPELILAENNYKELAFTYMNWKHGGYKECKKCGRLFKSKGNTQYCKKCSPKYKPIEYKTIKCVDCGAEVIISALDVKTTRCGLCQYEREIKLNRASSRERMRKYRNSTQCYG